MRRRITTPFVVTLVVTVAGISGFASTPQLECTPRFDHNRLTYCEFVPVGIVMLGVGDSHAIAMVAFSSEFFIGLQRRVKNAQKIEFRKASNVVENYPQEFTVTIEPLPDLNLKQTGTDSALPKPVVRLAPQMRPLRLVLRWLDDSHHPGLEESTDLKEIQEAWPELDQPKIWYQGTISGVNQQLNTSFQVLVFGDSGKLLGTLDGTALAASPR